jgi:hypothetical protein
MTTENTALDGPVEECFTPAEVARILKVKPRTVVRQFQNEPGVIEFGSDETLYKRKRKFMRIPKSVLERYLAKHRKVT